MKSIDGYDGRYLVSDDGKVWSNFTKKYLLPDKLHNGYLRVTLSYEGTIKRCTVHRLVAQTYIANPINLPLVNHKNGVRDDNSVDNLEWCTPSYNTRHGASNPRRGERHPNSKLKEGQVRAIIHRFAEGASRRSLADEYGVSQALIVHITQRTQWRHLNV